MFGDMLSVVAVLAYTMYFVLGRHVRSYVPVFTYMMVVTGAPMVDVLMPLLACGQRVALFHPWMLAALDVLCTIGS